MLCHTIAWLGLWLSLWSPGGPLGRSLDEWAAMLRSPQRTAKLLGAHALAVYAQDGFAALAKSPDPAVRYWFAVGVKYRADCSADLLRDCQKLLDDDDAVVRIAAAAALLAHGEADGRIEQVFRSALRNRQPGIRLEALTYLYECPGFAKKLQTEIEAILDEGDANPYEVRTLARKVLDAATAAQ